jgi:putative cardiolipin synthase
VFVQLAVPRVGLTAKRGRCARGPGWLATAVCTAALSGCASLPQPRLQFVPERALPRASEGVLADYGQRIEARLAPRESAHWLLDRNEQAFAARLALTDQAVESLDIQYFIWQEDATGHLLAARVLAAADRGVRIRLLLDDFTVASTRSAIAKLDAHPRIEVRLFNPWAARGSRVVKTVEFLLRWATLNRRMHNKTYIADGRFAIVGGRNIGDRYFGLYDVFVQNDLDVLVAGPLVSEVAASFDLFWNSPYVYPAALFDDAGSLDQSLAAVRTEISGAVASRADVFEAFPLQPASWGSYLDGLVDTFAAGSGELYYDSPEIHDEARERLYDRFKALVASAEREVLISSPYFIPDEDFRGLIRELVARGVRVAIVTNSLATNNHAIAHTGYKRWRRDILSAGAELYELRDDAEILALYVTPPVSAAALGLHSKAVVVDGRWTFVGSPNVDPRSMVLNTEIGVVTDSEELAERLSALISRDMSPENAWRVTMSADGWLEWSAGERSLQRQPAKGFRQRAVEFLLNLLPLKKQA